MTSKLSKSLVQIRSYSRHGLPWPRSAEPLSRTHSEFEEIAWT